MRKWGFQRLKLARKVTLATVAFSSFLTLIFILVQLSVQYVRENDEVKLSKSIIQNSLIKSLSQSVWNYDSKLIKLQLRGIINLPYISSVTINLSDGKYFSSGQSLENGGEVIKYAINHHLNPSETDLGELFVEIDTEQLRANLVHTAILIIIGSLVRAVIIVLFMLFIIEYLFGRHLVKIVNYLDNPKRNERLELPSRWGGKDELDLMVSSYNEMSHQVEVAHQQQLDDMQKQELLQRQLAQMDRQISLGEMATSLSHELNQPLATITGYADISKRLLSNQLNDEQKQNSKLPSVLEKISGEAIRASEIIRRIREFVKGRITHKEQFNLVEMLQHSVALINHSALLQAVAIKQDYSQSEVFVQGDKIQLQQVVVNILRNAVDAMKGPDQQGGKIYVSLLHVTPNIEITFRDTGPGIDDKILAEVFSPFVSTKADGMGVGLSISHNIIESHGGTLVATNLPQGGACFTIQLPSTTNDE